jgi:hypothetical protein
VALWSQTGRAHKASSEGVAFTTACAEGDCIGVRLHRASGQVEFSRNGVSLGRAFAGITGARSHNWLAAVSLKSALDVSATQLQQVQSLRCWVTHPLVASCCARSGRLCA